MVNPSRKALRLHGMSPENMELLEPMILRLLKRMLWLTTCKVGPERTHANDAFENWFLQSIAEIISFSDGAKLLSFMHTESDEKKKSELKTEFINTGVQPYLKGFERHLLQNNNGEGYLVGKNPTWADCVLVVFLGKRSWSFHNSRQS